jgi:hypothetical protein
MSNYSPEQQAIIDRLRQYHASGISPAHFWRQDRRITHLAIKYFGSWRAAFQAAGYDSVRLRWSRKRVIGELKKRHQARQAVEPKLSSAAKRYFGSIATAYAAAGLPVRCKPQPQSEWTAAQTVIAIQERQQSGASLAATCREAPALYAASKRLHGSWSNALRAAGCAADPTPYLSAQEVIERIADRLKTGLPLTCMERHDPLLARSAVKHFCGWRKALVAAGVDATVPRRWSKRTIVAAMQTRHQRGGPLSSTWREDKQLFRAAVRYFGSWENAMRAAGFDPIHRQRWSKRRVIERLQAWGERGGYRNIRDVDPNLSAAAARLFGNFDAALEAAGVEPSPRRWTDSRVVAAIQDRYVAGNPLHVEGLGDLKVALAAKRRFGSWQAAVEAAGLAGKIIIKKPLRRWTREAVIAEIQAWHRSGRRLSAVSKQNQSLSCAAKTWFGSWRAALNAAGLESERKVWSKQSLIDEVLNRSRNGRSLSSGDPANINLAAAASRYFGSWRKALQAADVLSHQVDSKGA